MRCRQMVGRVTTNPKTTRRRRKAATSDTLGVTLDE